MNLHNIDNDCMCLYLCPVMSSETVIEYLTFVHKNYGNDKKI